MTLDFQRFANEGQERESNYRVWKSHEVFDDFMTNINSLPMIIYIYRDPRDVAVSGSYYFNFVKYPLLRAIFARIPTGLRWYHTFIETPRKRIDRMIGAILYGDSSIGKWVKIPWIEHVDGYIDSGVLTIKFENMVDDPEDESNRILDYLDISRSDSYVHQAVIEQSIERRKKQALEDGDDRNRFFIRKGSSRQWEKALSYKQKKKFDIELGDRIKELGY